MNQVTREQILASITPKSDQYGYDDLINGGQMTVTVAGVSAGDSEQPINIRLDGHSKYYRPCKSMRRVLVFIWGDDGHKWVGQSMTLYGDPNVTFGKVKVGGIRISHMTGLAEAQTIPLSVKQGRKSPYVVKPLAVSASTGAQRGPSSGGPRPEDTPEGGNPSTTQADPPGDLTISTQGKTFSAWLTALKELLSEADDPDAAWDANLDTWNKFVTHDKTTEKQHGDLAALKDYWRACVDAKQQAANLGAG